MIAVGVVAAVLIVWSVLDHEPPPAPSAAGSGLERPKYTPPMATPPESLLAVHEELPGDCAAVVETSPMSIIDAEDEQIRYAEPVSGKVIRLQVLNGCGIKGIAKLVAPALRAKGFDVRETSNAGNFNYARTLVFDRTGILENALTVADSLGIEPANVTTQLARNLVDIDVTIIVGADYESLRMKTTNNSKR